MKRFVYTIITLVLCIMSLASCNEQLPPAQSMVYEPHAITPHVQAWGNYVFGFWGMGTQYNRLSGELFSDFCNDPECDGSCFLENHLVTLSQIYKGRLYFSSFEFITHNVYISYMDLQTGEVKVLLAFDENRDPMTYRVYIENDYLYYNSVQLKADGNPENYEDYTKYVCRIPADGGEEETVMQLRDWGETLMMVAEGKAVTFWNGALYMTDMSTKEQVKIFDNEENGWVSSLTECSYYDGFLYVLVNPKEGVKAPDGRPVNMTRLVCVDIEKATWRYLIDAPVHNFRVENEAIYFTPIEIRQVNDPTIYPPTQPEAFFFDYSATLYACDHDGGNIRAIYTDPTGEMDFDGYYTVIDNVFYGFLWNFDHELNTLGDRYFAEIHFDTGEIIPAIEEKSK